MLYACDQRFDVTRNLEKFLRTKQGVSRRSSVSDTTEKYTTYQIIFLESGNWSRPPPWLQAFHVT